ncbi:MAG: class II aldolase/adducin family protein [Candidatus Neomarinimicrobiota bacterium]
MHREFAGARFIATFKRRRKIPTQLTQELSLWCRRIWQSGLAPASPSGFAGNISVRYSTGFIISVTGAEFSAMQNEDFTQVLATDIEERMITVAGRSKPSSESFLHDMVYRCRPEINAVIHGHDDLVLQHHTDMQLPVTAREHPSGTLELTAEAIKVLNHNDYILLRNHGFLALGETQDMAGNLALRKHEVAAVWAEPAQ